MRPFGLAGLVALSACVQAAAPARPAATEARLDGEWRVATLDGVAVAGLRSDARFANGAFTIAFGCNTLRGGYRLEPGRLVPVYPMGATEIACGAAGDGPDPMAMEQRGFAIVGRPMRITFEGPNRVRLANEAGSIELMRR